MSGAAAAIVGIAETCTRESAGLMRQRLHYEGAAASTFEGLSERDERMAALLECLELQGDRALDACRGVMEEEEEPAAAFAWTWLALHRRLPSALEAALAAAGGDGLALAAATRGAAWAPAALLKGMTGLDREAPPALVLASLEVCAMHRVDPGPSLRQLLDVHDATCRARALRSAGEHGRVDLLGRCIERSQADQDADCRRWAAWAAVLLGDRGDALDALGQGLAGGSLNPADPMLATLLGCMPAERGQAWLRAVAANAVNPRVLIAGAGLCGDPRYAAWLIEQMNCQHTARLAAEAFRRITGAPLQGQGGPAAALSGPNDDPGDDHVALDEDDGLPWPRAEVLASWWDQHAGRFRPGRRYLGGEPVTVEHCVEVLRHGMQRERGLAALHLGMLRPGVPLYNVRAPAWRQRRWLALMSPGS